MANVFEEATAECETISGNHPRVDSGGEQADDKRLFRNIV